MNTVLVLVVFSWFFISLTQSQTVLLETITIQYGIADNFSSPTGQHEWVPRSGAAASCVDFDWTLAPPYYFAGDDKPMAAPWFDTKPAENALVFTVSGLPIGQILQNAQIQMYVKGDDALASNDGFGFLWDENENWAGTCRVPWFRTFSNVTGFGTLASNVYKYFTLNLTSDMRLSSTMTILQKISQTGYFHFLVGDDTSVDYFKFVFTIYGTPDNIVSYSCVPYLSGRFLARSTYVYSDESVTQIVNITDSFQYAFTGTTLISPASVDRTSTQSTFKFHLDQATRFWLFVPVGVTLSWVSAGGWDPLTGASVLTNRGTTTTNQQFSVYTKRYEAGRWVIFGPASVSSTSQSASMYFVSYAFSPSLVVAPNNPAASCKCHSSGDPHYATFDSRSYSLYVPGIYHLVKSRDCTFDVQTLTYKYIYGGNPVSVNGIVSVRYLNNVVTIAKNPPQSGNGAWTGPPTVRVNGVVTTSSTTQGGLVVTYINANTWNVSIPSVGLVVQTISSTLWFDILPSLSDLSYQRTVDGLCGNCDVKPWNDFKFPNCSNAIANNATKLGTSDMRAVINWGNTWLVPNRQVVANTSLLTSTLTGSNAYAACLASPLIQHCPDLVLPEPPKITGNLTTTVVEPLPPSNWVRCDGTTPIYWIEIIFPPPPPPPPPVVLCEDRPDYEDIKARCAYCANLTLYEADDCILDICLSGLPASQHQCAGLPGCQTPVITKSFTSSGYQWATLDDADSTGTPTCETTCQPAPLRIPLGWEVAPADDVSKTVIGLHYWESACVATNDGASHGTAVTKLNGWQGSCPSGSSLIKSSDACYHANHCGIKILLRKPLTAICGNGILESIANEQCDDGNTNNNDGCDNNCRLATTGDWICQTGVNPTKCTATFTQTTQVHNCTIASPYCQGCDVTPANQAQDTCCVCNYPCC